MLPIRYSAPQNASYCGVTPSSNPNCGIKVNGAGAHDFVARKGIAVNEEITFDYAMRNYIIDCFPQNYMCASKRCRGRIIGRKIYQTKIRTAMKTFQPPAYLSWIPSILARKWWGVYNEKINKLNSAENKQ